MYLMLGDRFFIFLCNVVFLFKTREISFFSQGFYGTGVTVTIVDDGVQYIHPDLMENFDQRASYDWNNQDDDVTPHPRLGLFFLSFEF